MKDTTSNYEIISLLNEIGFTRYESKVYTALLSGGVASAREISSCCGIPYGKVYEVLNGLVSKGVILVSVTRPMQYKPSEPSKVLGSIRKNVYCKIKNAEKALQAVEPPAEVYTRIKTATTLHQFKTNKLFEP